MEGMFYQQLFSAMRATIPQSDSALSRTSDEMFGPMMDEHMAEAAAAQRVSGLGEALYRQLVAAATSSTTNSGAQGGDE